LEKEDGRHKREKNYSRGEGKTVPRREAIAGGRESQKMRYLLREILPSRGSGNSVRRRSLRGGKRKRQGERGYSLKGKSAGRGNIPLRKKKV